MTCVTVSSMVLAEAPGYLAVTTTCGEAISGNWATGKALKAKAPAAITTMAKTQAKMGRLMKKPGKFMVFTYYLPKVRHAPFGQV